ncbi:MAG: hypothetical protein HETSPECPRED_008669 [Heterodermia speciosa]|uniref:Uncharacterized protein n=1 Tax=Heterodermia speciosa TaxID=116794 RepID=A0A8H3IV08_9LECA|nr:MAG: hypothetical protein HETSPECPRED_008669 [Heterodermia speciosa]
MAQLIAISSNPIAYNGPYFDVRALFNGPIGPLGKTIQYLRTACMQYYAPSGEQPGSWNYTRSVADCIFNNLSEHEKAEASTHQYFLTLWPAFISIIVAMGIDAAPIAYDNLAWTAIYLLTSGAMPGFETTAFPHQVVAAEVSEARKLCESWQDDYPARKVSRLSRLRRNTYAPMWMDLALMAASLGLWLTFVIYYVVTLHRSFTMTETIPWCYGVMWYLVAAFPMLFGALPRLVLNNVDLYDPRAVVNVKASSRTGAIDKRKGTAKNSSAQLYEHRKMKHGFHTWCRLAFLQLSSRPYRVLVHPFPQSYLLASYNYLVAIGRFGVFIWGSMAQGVLTFVPTPTDYYLAILLLFTTATPRLIAPKFLRSGRRGADLVVSVERLF